MSTILQSYIHRPPAPLGGVFEIREHQHPETLSIHWTLRDVGTTDMPLLTAFGKAARTACELAANATARQRYEEERRGLKRARGTVVSGGGR